jgi:phosphoserine phosphatase RsbX
LGEWPEGLEVGTAGTPLAGERRSGDLSVCVPFDGGALVAAVDGLGHGELAADAAALAGDVLRATPWLDLPALLTSCHDALRRTRGVVLTAVRFEPALARMTWVGVGNVEGRLLRVAEAPLESVMLHGGVLGFQLPQIRPTTAQLEPGDTVVLATDGIRAAFSRRLLRPAAPPQVLAERLLAEEARGNDDALVVVARFGAA